MPGESQPTTACCQVARRLHRWCWYFTRAVTKLTPSGGAGSVFAEMIPRLEWQTSERLGDPSLEWRSVRENRARKDEFRWALATHSTDHLHIWLFCCELLGPDVVWNTDTGKMISSTRLSVTVSLHLTSHLFLHFFYVKHSVRGLLTRRLNLYLLDKGHNDLWASSQSRICDFPPGGGCASLISGVSILNNSQKSDECLLLSRLWLTIAAG